MKNYYNKLNKEKQKEIKLSIKKSHYKDVIKRINMYILMSYLSIGIVICDIYFRYYFNGKKIDYIIDSILIIAMLLYSLKLYKTKDKVLNNYALELKKEKK